MRETRRVESHHTRFNIIATEEVTSVIEQHFVVVIIVVIERHFQRTVALNRAWYKSTYDKPSTHKRVCAEGGKW